MKKKFTNRSRARKGTLKFNPKRDYIQKAINEYLANGGTITRLEFNEESYKYFVSVNDPIAVDGFLLGD